MRDIAEGIKIDTALQAQTNQTELEGEWFRMTTFAKALFLITIQGQLTGASLDFDVYEATDATGSGENQLGETIAMAQGIKINSANVAPAGTTSADETLKITPWTFVNGVLTEGTELTFTAKDGETLASRYFDQNSGGTAEAISIAACINDATYGVPGMLATVHDTDEVTLTMTEPGDGVFTITESETAKLIVTDLVQQALFEVAVQDLDRDDNFTHVGARVSGVDAGTEFSCLLIRAVAGYQPVGQAVADSDDATTVP